MGTPQIIVIVLIVLYALSLGVVLSKHGKPETRNHSVWSSLLAVAVMSALLWWAGFWS
jgi:hypothetical protein